LLDKIGQSAISIGLRGSKVNFIELILEVVLKTQTVIVLFFVMIATELAASKGNVISALKPLNPLEVVFFHGEDGDEHALLVERAFFDDVEDVESTYSFVCVPDSEEKPIVVAVGVEVVFDDEMVLLGVSI